MRLHQASQGATNQNEANYTSPFETYTKVYIRTYLDLVYRAGGEVSRIGAVTQLILLWIDQYLSPKSLYCRGFIAVDVKRRTRKPIRGLAIKKPDFGNDNLFPNLLNHPEKKTIILGGTRSEHSKKSICVFRKFTEHNDFTYNARDDAQDTIIQIQAR